MSNSFPIIFNKNKIKQVLILLPLQREGLTSYLSPILGQYGIRNVDFINQFITVFNSTTSNIFAQQINTDNLEQSLSTELDLVIPIYFTVYKNGKFEIITGYSLIGSLYRTTFKKRRRFYRAKTSYRNFKKLFQLSIFFVYTQSEQIVENASFCLRLLPVYDQIRNSLYAKK